MARSIRTMEEFSEYAGVSRPTVSRYFRNPESVRKSTRETIEVALRKSGFRPNLFAVNINRRRSNIIGVLFSDRRDPFSVSLGAVIEQHAGEAGYLALILSADSDGELEQQAIHTFESMNVAGVIAAPLGTEGSRRALAALGDEVPVISVDAPLDAETSFVGTDFDQSIGLITDYLCRTGIAPCFMGLPEHRAGARARERAYVAAMHRFGMSPAIVPLEPVLAADEEAFGFEQTMRIIGGSGFPNRAVLCASDRLALGAISAAYQRGLVIGHGPNCDLRIAGHDDHPLARYACPPLTTVARNPAEIAERAVRMLVDRLDNEETAIRTSIVPAELMLRASA